MAREKVELSRQLEKTQGQLQSKENAIQGLSVSLDEEKYKNSLSESERQSIGQNSSFRSIYEPSLLNSNLDQTLDSNASVDEVFKTCLADSSSITYDS